MDCILEHFRRSEDLSEIVMRNTACSVIAGYVALFRQGKDFANGPAVRLNRVFQGLDRPHVMAWLTRRSISTGTQRSIGESKKGIEGRVEAKVIGDSFDACVFRAACDNAHLI
jgi:hypothetical protein